MKTIHFNLKAKKAGTDDSTAWLEEYTYNVPDDVTPEIKGKEIVDFFNRTLRPNEDARVFLDSIDLDNPKSEVYFARDRETAPKLSVQTLKHTWEKFSLVTEKGGYDIYRCSTCGAKGKRFGLSSTVTPDKRVNGHVCKGKK